MDTFLTLSCLTLHWASILLFLVLTAVWSQQFRSLSHLGLGMRELGLMLFPFLALCCPSRLCRRLPL